MLKGEECFFVVVVVKAGEINVDLFDIVNLIAGMKDPVMGGGSDYAKMLDSQIEHLSHFSWNLTDESREC